MPRQLKIPDRYKPSFKFLAGLSPEEFSKLLNALATTQPTLDPAVFSERVISKDSTQDPKEVHNLISGLVPLFWIGRDGTGTETLPDDIMRAIRSDASFEFTESDVSTLKARLAEVLSLEQTLGATAKARSIYLDHQQTYCEAKIVTDIRPIYQSDAKLPPVAAAVVHTLKITYHKEAESGHGEFYVTMDNADLIALETIIARAKDKAIGAEHILDKCHIPLIKEE